MTVKAVTKQRYRVEIESPFLLTQKQVKERFGIGFIVVSIEIAKDIPTIKIVDVDSAVEAIVNTGYRALARANHPDLGGDPEIMVIINRAKKELLDLLNSLKGDNV